MNASHENISSRIYKYLFIELADERTNNWFLVNSPITIFAIAICYLNVVLYWGPWFMKDRKPFKLKKVMFVYNICQITFSSWLVIKSVVMCFLWHNISIKCLPLRSSLSAFDMEVAGMVYAYFLAKISELIETVFFVLRKKNEQVSFLHLYHHTYMLITSWLMVKYFPGGQGVSIGIINSFVHAVMYTYYFLSALGPHVQKYLWWKKYITKLQMTQFILVIIHQSQVFIYNCAYPKGPIFYYILSAIIFYSLFNKFYKEAYYKQKRKHEIDTFTINPPVMNGKPEHFSLTSQVQDNVLCNGNSKKTS